ncbi:MAG: hypothetical protein WCK46_01640 [Candidatus Adlerbacteria bacterium]
MGKRGPKPKKIVSEVWTPELAYAVGLLATDGGLSPPGHLIDLTSKDVQQLENYRNCLNISTPITKKLSGIGKEFLRVQFKNVYFYNFLLSVGLTPAKSKTLGPLKIPNKFFFDFLRGVFDGDGCTYSYFDPRWHSSFMIYSCVASSSSAFVAWLQETLAKKLAIKGHITVTQKKHYQLRYAKTESIKLLKKMYSQPGCICLRRKRLKIEKMLSIVGEHL